MKKILVFAVVAAMAGLLAGRAYADAANGNGEPAKQVQPATKTEAKATKTEPKRHKVEAGDSLSSIAEKEKLESWRPLWNVNKDLTDPDQITEGQDLIVPDGPTEDRPVPEKPAPVAYVPAVPVARRAGAAPANYAEGAGGILARVRMREAGGNYATNTGNGYYGAYQFDLGTWRGVGGSGLPSDASPAEQDARAAALYAQRGCSPWPNTCR